MQQPISSERFKNWTKPEIKHGELTKWNWVVYHPENLTLGNRVDIGIFTYINAECGVVIKDNVQIGGGVKIYSHSTIDNKKGNIILEEGCKIGANSVIMPNVVIGENAIVGALSFVNQSIPANEVWGGIPAKKL